MKWVRDHRRWERAVFCGVLSRGLVKENHGGCASSFDVGLVPDVPDRLFLGLGGHVKMRTRCESEEN
jgi:hypothetical protein